MRGGEQGPVRGWFGAQGLLEDLVYAAWAHRFPREGTLVGRGSA